MTTPFSQTRDMIILLVDDDPGDQELTRRALAEDVIKTDLRIVSDGEEAMDYLNRRGKYQEANTAPTPDLILLDLNMPKMDGRQVLEQLQTDSNLNAIPVVVMTTSQQEEDILRSYKLGCNSFVNKPVEINSFVDAVRQLGAYWFKLVALPTKAG